MTLVVGLPRWAFSQSDNSARVSNTPLIQRFAPDNALDINGFTVGSPFGELFSGFRGFSLTPRRVAMTAQSYEGEDYQTLFADPDFCTNVCAPKLARNVLVGSWSDDSGVTYLPVFADVGSIVYVDSAQDYSNGGTTDWDTRSYPNRFSPDSTIGIRVHETHIAVRGIAELSDFVLTIMDVTNRSSTDSIIDLVHFAFHDNDPASGDPQRDVVRGAAEYGLGFTRLDASQAAHGYVRAGYGCETASDIIRVRGLNQAESSWNFEVAGFYDSLYQFCRFNEYAGVTSQYSESCPPFCDNGDRATLYTLGRFSLGPAETKTLVFAEFVRTNNTGPFTSAELAPLAQMINAFAGFGRGDVNSDSKVDLADILFLSGTVSGGAGPYPFAHLGDVNADNSLDAADVTYLLNYYFNCGPCPQGNLALERCF